MNDYINKLVQNDVAQNKGPRDMRSEVLRVERQIEQLVDRIVASDVSSISTAFENRVRSLEIEKATLTEKIALCGRPAADFDSTYRTAMEFLENPYKLWVSDKLADKRTVLKLAFAEPIAYARNEGFRTAEAAIPFKIFNALELLDSEESEMVPITGALSNQLFSTLENWNHILKAGKARPEPSNDMQKPRRKRRVRTGG